MDLARPFVARSRDRSAPIQNSLRVFSQRRVDALDVLQQARIDLTDEPAQAKGIDEF